MTAGGASGEREGGPAPAARVGLFETEERLASAAGETARRWAQAGLAPLVVVLRGDLGSGKTTWVRAMLRGLGHRGRVPSPTYTLVEHYVLTEAGLTVVHLDLYRLADDGELENLGLRDWLAEPVTWLLVEWPERSAALEALADVELRLEIAGPASRRVAASAKTARGQEALDRMAVD
ncbi:MAG TPA: tRNA (adenosine(37)-N6)-threonylcarbamoyltransferase complex ATPase subunit type 1 TsaE [Gammaproteobacteria bacterium]